MRPTLLACLLPFLALAPLCAYQQPAPGTPPQKLEPILAPGDRTSETSKTTLSLAKGGKALLPIILAPDASESLKETAQYLAEKLHKITGAQFSIQSGDGSSGIVVGTLQQFPVKELQGPLEISKPLAGLDIPNGVEAYGIRVEPQRLLLLGGGELGASHAVARFLDLLGYRQFYPAPEWEVVPKIETLTFSHNETDRPTILARRIWFAFGTPMDPLTLTNANEPPEKRTVRSKTDLPAWARQNLLGESFRVFNAHYWSAIINQNKEEFTKHPEYYSLAPDLKTGEMGRVPRSICVSNPRVRQMAVQVAFNYFDKNPDAVMVSMERGDGDVMCLCENCKALGNDSNRVLGLANEVARAVAQKFPGKMVGVLGYNLHDLPPDFGIEPNVHVQVARLFNQSRVPFHERIGRWKKATNNLGVYDYFSTYQHGQDRLRRKASAGPTGNLERLKSDIRFFGEQELLSVSSESSVAWGAHGRGNYVAARMMWNPQADVNALLKDFYEKAFGPAAAAMQRYFERVDGQNEHFTKTLLGLAMRDVAEAAQLAKNDPEVTARIDQIKQFLYFNYLQNRSFATRGTPEEKSWVLELLKHQFRTRYSYMTHWHAHVNFLPDLAKRFHEPSWVLPNGKEVAAAKKDNRPLPEPPWLDWKPYSHDETEKKFQEALQFFQPKAVLTEAQFSDDLVPVEFPNAPPLLESRQVQTYSGTIRLFSISGEPLEISIKSGKNGAADIGAYTLEDPSGKVVSQGRIPQDESEHALTLNVPSAGLYLFRYSPVGAWSYSTPPGTPNTLSSDEQGEGARYTLNGQGGRNFFYVPKDTKQIQYIWGGGEHNLYDPTGSVAATITDTHDYITVDVPPGMDGAVWSFNGRYSPRHFVNIPGFFAPSPESLLIPRELAEKDGLTIRAK